MENMGLKVLVSSVVWSDDLTLLADEFTCVNKDVAKLGLVLLVILR